MCMHVCICVYFGPPIGLECLRVRPGPRLIMVLVWGGFVAGWVGGGWGCYTCELRYCKPQASSLTWSSRYVSLGENDSQLSPFRAKGEISHIWFIYTFVQKWRNIKKEIQICLRNEKIPAFQLDRGVRAIFEEMHNPCCRDIEELPFIGTPTDKNGASISSPQQWVSCMLPRAGGALLCVNANKSVIWWNLSLGHKSEWRNCGFRLEGGRRGRRKRKGWKEGEKESKREREREVTRQLSPFIIWTKWSLLSFSAGQPKHQW